MREHKDIYFWEIIGTLRVGKEGYSPFPLFLPLFRQKNLGELGFLFPVNI